MGITGKVPSFAEIMGKEGLVMDIVQVVGWITVIVGWYITYKITISAQNKAFHNQIMNEARKQISHALREYQSRLAEMHSHIMVSRTMAEIEQVAVTVDWIKRYQEAVDLRRRDSYLDWIFMLEEYEILFPETRELRIELTQRRDKLSQTFYKYVECLSPHIPKNERVIALEAVKSEFPTLLDQIALIQDLRIYLQNKSLNKITGNTVPSRQPQDPSVPRVILQGGMLKIVDGGEKSGEQGTPRV